MIQGYGVPRVDKVAEALARRFNWNIAPSGDTALNIMHISTQVPNAWEYVSDGPYRDYMIGKVPLKFKHVMPREINDYSPITVMVIQGIRAIGKGNMTQEQADRFSSVCCRDIPIISLTYLMRKTWSLSCGQMKCLIRNGRIRLGSWFDRLLFRPTCFAMKTIHVSRKISRDFISHGSLHQYVG